MANEHKQEQILARIASADEFLPDFTQGLNSTQVEKRIKDGLNNKSPKKVTKTYWQILVDNLFSFFNIVLFAIMGLMIWAQIGIKYYFFVIPLVCNIIIGLYCDLHARHLVDKLRLITDPKVKVVRDGKEEDIGVNDVVLSDIVILKAGDQIVADAIVLEGRLKTDESLITGEVDAVEKTQGSQVFSGSFVKSGTAYVRVTRVGIANYAEGLQSHAQKFSRPKSELKRSCLAIFWVTGVIALFMGFMMLIAWKFGPSSHESLHQFMLRVSGSMVAMIPSGLYLLVSLTLATGVISLAKKRMNVQELYCIEMLARVDTICFDKTGTLTDGHLLVKDLYNLSEYSDKEIKDVFASLVNATKDTNSTAEAIAKSYPEHTLNATAVLPFDSDHKYSAVTFEKNGTWIMGAYGFIDGKISDEGKNRVEQLSKRGYRVIVLYYNKKPIEHNNIPAKSQFMAALVLQDHIKQDAKANIEWFKNNGVDIKVISGDSAITVSEIANEVGVPNAANYVSMENVKDDEIPALALSRSVFGRVKPEQKALIVSALQSVGHKVAMTGDGINDIIALKTADCSIAMASGSSAAKNVAHMISVDNDFSKLPDVVKEGRRVINNLQRTASLFLSKTMFAIVLSIIFLISSWTGHMGYPFTTSNMTIWEVVTIGGGGFFLALQPSDEKLQGSFMKNVLSHAAPAGFAEILSVLVIYGVSIIWPNFLDKQTAHGLCVITFTTLSYLVLFRICWPFDKYRRFVFWGLLLVGGLFFLADYLVTINSGKSASLFFDISYTEINYKHVLFIIGTIIVMATIYFLLDRFIRKWIMKEKKEKQII